MHHGWTGFVERVVVSGAIRSVIYRLPGLSSLLFLVAIALVAIAAWVWHRGRKRPTGAGKGSTGYRRDKGV